MDIQKPAAQSTVNQALAVAFRPENMYHENESSRACISEASDKEV